MQKDVSSSRCIWLIHYLVKSLTPRSLRSPRGVFPRLAVGQLGAAAGRLLGLMLPTDTNLIVVKALERLCTPTSLSLLNTRICGTNPLGRLCPRRDLCSGFSHSLLILWVAWFDFEILPFKQRIQINIVKKNHIIAQLFLFLYIKHTKQGVTVAEFVLFFIHFSMFLDDMLLNSLWALIIREWCEPFHLSEWIMKLLCSRWMIFNAFINFRSRRH